MVGAGRMVFVGAPLHNLESLLVAIGDRVEWIPNLGSNVQCLPRLPFGEFAICILATW